MILFDVLLWLNILLPAFVIISLTIRYKQTKRKIYLGMFGPMFYTLILYSGIAMHEYIFTDIDPIVFRLPVRICVSLLNASVLIWIISEFYALKIYKEQIEKQIKVNR